MQCLGHTYIKTIIFIYLDLKSEYLFADLAILIWVEYQGWEAAFFVFYEKSWLGPEWQRD